MSPEPPRGFGSFPPDDVTWLVKDLGRVSIERPVEEREEETQRGRHYAETLPIEYRPSPAYEGLFRDALRTSAHRVAHAAGVVAEQVLARRGPGVVLASLARGGTPVGILVRRWLLWSRGLDVPHYTISILRGRGIDRNAVRWLLARHPAERVQFVDGWTGKGAIARELREACRASGLRDDLAVLADPGHCADLFGTRDDFLVPSACLNATVSGLVSRTVLNAELIGPDDFHGATWYPELSAEDRSNLFVDTIAAAFPAVADAVAGSTRRLLCTDADERRPTWAGAATVAAIQERHGISDVNLVKPGVGETIRVLLRRVPWKVLVRPDRLSELGPVLQLARERGVDVAPEPSMTYSACGLIRPMRSRQP